MPVLDHPHDWVAKHFADGSHAVGCRGCDYIGLVGTEAQVAKAVSTALLVAQATRKPAASADRKAALKRLFRRR
jgi:hypothetical protein